MKKSIAIILISALVFVLVFGLIACNGVTPSDAKIRKVKQALDGVEHSMQGSSSMNEVTLQSHKSLYLAAEEGAALTSEDALQTIWNVYGAGDRQSSIDPEIEYDQPPMQQFRYLKAIFEQMGDDYALGTKYYYDITGQMYFDMETGYPVNTTEVSDPDRYRYDYVFGFSMSIELRENDLIFAEVAFKIGLTQGAASYNTSWYVRFDLDYNFDETKPTYTLAMYTDNKEGELPFLDRMQGYEYDYVQVSKGDIKEWRKFVMDASEEIVIDEAHPSFDSYLSEDFSYRADTAKWVKNGQYYKVTQLNADKNRILAGAFVDGIGMNSTSIGGAAFFAKSGTQNSVIDTYYKSICQVYGGDIIYDLVCKKDYSNSGDNGSSAHAWNSSVGSVVGALSSFVPGFESATASFSAMRSDDGSVMISVSGAAADDYARFMTALERVGFVQSGVEEGNVLYIKTTASETVMVAINSVGHYVLVAVRAGGGGGGGGEGGIGGDVTTEKTITLHEYLPAYAYGYTAYNAGVRYTAVKDLTSIIEDISCGLITPEEITAPGSLSVNDSWFYDITLSYDATSGKTMEEAAADIAKRYSGDYLGADSIWTNRENNMLHYATINGKEVLVLLATDVANGDPHLYVYMLQFEEGNIPAILDGNGKENGKEGGDIPGGNGGSEGDEGGEGNIVSVDVIILFFDESGNEFPPETRTYTLGEVLTVDMIVSEAKQKVFLDASFKEEVKESVIADSGLVLYVRATAPEGGDEGGEEDLTTYVSVLIVTLSVEGQIIDTRSVTFSLGEEIDLTKYARLGKIYTDKDCMTEVVGSVCVVEGLMLYIKPQK